MFVALSTCSITYFSDYNARSVSSGFFTSYKLYLLLSKLVVFRVESIDSKVKVISNQDRTNKQKKFDEEADAET